MTLHNLDEQLAWLLRTKPSIPPANTSLPAAGSLSPVRASQPATSIEDFGFGTLDDVESTEVPAAEEREADMVRLRTGPSSASKPRLMSMNTKLSDDTSSTRPRTSNSNGEYNPRPTAQIGALGRTPTKHSRPLARIPDDVEIMDLTETTSTLDSPSTRLKEPEKSSRKRKSDEFEFDLAPVRSTTRPTLSFAPKEPQSSDGFSSIEDMLEEFNGPPPPYSTVPPRPPKSNGTSLQGASAGAGRVMPDSDIDDDDIVSFTGNPHKRTRIEKRPSPAKPRLAESNITASEPLSPSRRTANANSKIDSKQFFQQFAHSEKTSRASTPVDNLKISSSNLGTQTGEKVSDDVQLLRRFFAINDADLMKILDPLQARSEELIESVAEQLDEHGEAVELESELDDLDKRLNTIKSLFKKRTSYKVLHDEKDQLMLDLKAAIKARQGKEAAMEANKAGKERIQAFETECLSALNFCRQSIESFFQSLDSKPPPKSVTIQSTQALPAKAHTYEPTVPSSSKVLQTQIATRFPPPPLPKAATTSFSRDQQFGTHQIDKYFSQPATQSNSRPAYDHNINDFDDEEEEFNAAHANLFTNRMGTPPAPANYHEEDDFGLGEDDDDGMLELANDFETNGFAAIPPPTGGARSVFKERSPNRQGPTPKAKSQKAINPADDLEGRLFSFPWSNDVKGTLKERFRLRGFRESQLEAINATLGGKDAFVLMPTGGGKSLCYQLPALVRSGKTRGVTVVISPLLSLMEDQVQHLRNLNIQAFLINSETDPTERRAILGALEERNVQDFIQLLYVTPEMVAKSQQILRSFDQLYNKQQFARIVIDEAHCVSQWGHDFRPDYKSIGEVRKKYPRVPVIALTATATENVKVDVIHNLNIKGCEVFTRSFNRPNLYYEVRAKGKAKEDLASIASVIKEKHKGQTGIIYCLSRQNCEDYAQALTKEHKIMAHHFHAGMDPKEKKEVQKKWQSGEYKVIVATIAFGMGIDKANVRFVIHHSVPKSLEGYYQETGRAGRDGKRSSCYLYYGYQDAGKLRRMIDQGEGSWEQKDRQHQMLKKMIQYCENRSDCRRVQVLAYFSEAFQREACEKQCDNCSSGSNFELHDFTDYARQAVEIVEQIAKDKVTILQCMDVFRGYKSAKVKTGGWASLQQFGAGSDLDREDVERLFYRLLGEGAFREDQEMNRAGFATAYLFPGRNARDFKAGRNKFQLEIRSTPRAKKTVPKKKNAKDGKDEQARDWKTTAGSRSRTELPVSTNVSSPIQAASKRKTSRQPTRPALHANGYEQDQFVVSDGEDDDYEDDESDGFEPIRVAGTKRQGKTKELGPPIQTDDIMDRLDETHRALVDDFVWHAKEESKRLTVARNLRTVPFTDTMLRDMAIHFTVTQDEMLSKIRGINPEKVQLFGKHFIKLVKKCKDTYEEMMAQGTELPNDPNAQNVIDLVSDDEDEPGEDEDDEFGSVAASDFDEDEGEPSAYFQQAPPEVQAFNARVAASQPQPKPQKAPKPTSRKSSGKGRKRQWHAKGASGAGRNFASGSRYASNGSNSRSTTAGVTKRKPSRTKSNGSRTGGGRASGGNGGISMMPT